jgi:hypothetical protein
MFDLVNLNELILRYEKIKITKTYYAYIYWTTAISFIGPHTIVLGIVGQRESTHWMKLCHGDSQIVVCKWLKWSTNIVLALNQTMLYWSWNYYCSVFENQCFSPNHVLFFHNALLFMVVQYRASLVQWRELFPILDRWASFEMSLSNLYYFSVEHIFACGHRQSAVLTPTMYQVGICHIHWVIQTCP